MKTTRVLLALAGLLLSRAPAMANAAALAPCARLYAAVVFDGAVDYAKVARHPDRAACERAIAEAAPPDAKAPAAAVAFWSDAYNLLTMLAIADDPARYSPRQDGKQLFRDRVFVVAGQSMTLDQLEHDRLSAHTHDPRVEFLLSCGTRSCSLLPAKLLSERGAEGSVQGAIDAAMLEGMRRWFARGDNLRVVREDGVVEVGQLLQHDWHGQDFERAGTTLVELVARALDERNGPGERVAAADLRAGRLRLRVRPYDWRINHVRRVFALP
jgi:hypothetical protein